MRGKGYNDNACVHIWNSQRMKERKHNMPRIYNILLSHRNKISSFNMPIDPKLNTLTEIIQT